MIEEQPINNGGRTGKDSETGKFLEGNTFGEGRPRGAKNFDTIFEAAIRKIVAEKKIDIADPEMDMVIKAVVEALKGNYSFFRDIMDRRYGRAPQPLVGGDENWKPIQIIIEKEKNDTSSEPKESVSI